MARASMIEPVYQDDIHSNRYQQHCDGQWLHGHVFPQHNNIGSKTCRAITRKILNYHVVGKLLNPPYFSIFHREYDGLWIPKAP